MKAGPGSGQFAPALSTLALCALALCALALCAPALSGCASSAAGAVPPGLSAEEKDAITHADRACDQASTGAAIDPSSHCYVRRRSP